MSAMELFKGNNRKTWQLRITDHKGRRRTLSTRQSSRSNALSVAHKIESLIGARVRGDPNSPELTQWLTNAHDEIRKKLAAWEIIAVGSAEGGRAIYNPERPAILPADWKDPPPSLVDQWKEDLEEKEVTEDYAAKCAARVSVLLSTAAADHPPILYLADITSAGVMARIHELRRVGPPARTGHKIRKPATPHTCQHYLNALHRFLAWSVSKGFLGKNPIEGMVAYTGEVIAANKKRDRRALTQAEKVAIITGTPGLATRWKMTGAERSLLYRFVLRSGLRAKEVKTLRVVNLNFFTRTFLILAADSKARREDTLPIAAELIEPMTEHVKNKLPQAPVFPPLSASSYNRMLKEDLEDLGIEYVDVAGRYADFHALRHTYGTDLASVVMPAIHQKLMRHADINTTMKFYTHIEAQDHALALARLPSLMAPQTPAEQNKAG